MLKFPEMYVQLIAWFKQMSLHILYEHNGFLYFQKFLALSYDLYECMYNYNKLQKS